MNAVRSVETSVIFYQTIPHHIPEDSSLYRHEDFKFDLLFGIIKDESYREQKWLAFQGQDRQTDLGQHGKISQKVSVCLCRVNVYGLGQREGGEVL
jgi:hypothetical protein